MYIGVFYLTVYTWNYAPNTTGEIVPGLDAFGLMFSTLMAFPNIIATVSLIKAKLTNPGYINKVCISPECSK